MKNEIEEERKIAVYYCVNVIEKKLSKGEQTPTAELWRLYKGRQNKKNTRLGIIRGG